MKYGLTKKDMQLARKLLSNGEIPFNQLMKGLNILYNSNKRAINEGEE